MTANQTNSIQTLKQLVTNMVTEMLRLLDAENFNELLDSTADIFEAGRFLAFEAIEILEENGIETESWKIITHESFREIIEEAYDFFESLPSRQERSDIQMAEVKEKLKQILRKFLEVETILNDQHD